MPSESDKWGWEHVSVFGGFDRGSGTKRWKCNHCNLRYNGSYSRVRAHLLGFSGVGVKSCPAIDRSLREAFQILEEERLARKKKRISGNGKPGKRIRTSQSTLTVKNISKEDVDDMIARFFYADGLNVNVINSPYFLEMLKAISAFGPGYELPSIDKFSDSFLSKEKERIEKFMASIRESWPHTGCSMLCISRLDSTLGYFHISIFVSSPRGLIFLKAVDIDDTDETENLFASVLIDAILEVGPTNVLQIISHLGHPCKSSESLVLSKFPHIFWSPCTSHSIHMLMEEIAGLEWIKSIVSCAKEIEQLMMYYQHAYPGLFTHNLKESSDPLSAKFAPSYCFIQRIFELKQVLQEAVVSEEFKQWKLNMQGDNVIVESAILGDDFWCKVHLFLQLCEPFVRLLATFDIDKSPMGIVHEWRVQALEAVRTRGIDSTALNQLEVLIENRWDLLFSPLHAVAYMLNPRYFGRGQSKDKTLMRGWKATLERYECDSSARRILREQLSSYWRLEGSLGEEDAVEFRDKMEPVAWWENFGFETQQLQTLAIKVLSQVSSVAMCQEIWQENDFPCRETANRLGVDRVEDLVFVRNNLRLHSQRYGNSSSPSGQRNANLSYPSGVKSCDSVHLDQTMSVVNIHDGL
ncbi:uncharacterized protein LOC116114653 [Pistacia vera]|uniref:uncharacterized protein LOC116108057 n=1 Tax=Pistacia vera TaxID=55513 RepID=UPI00126381A9|nr:uncharacterized protein LOC116108057 [Pistacia vera]XP_031256655.1 uncharacterized protein LOC116114653 [Pistacia vera]XP_031256656.1 uncharacterized protein LOC116114653 [Pistacia vera]